ncbi:MAG TPA: flagellar assembly protein FliX [Alphaproteobacteria bacterium]|nr:flagellar assembly protein FliX [Alphaproteobacteria bacterium]
MKIDPTVRLNTSATRRAGKARRSGGAGDFANQVASSGKDSTPAAGVTSPLSVNPLIAMQEVADATSGASRAKAQAEAVLDSLDDLRMGLLAGRLSRDRLDGLVRLARKSREPNLDSRLTAVLDEIELRAKVELAKLDIVS